MISVQNWFPWAEAHVDEEIHPTEEVLISLFEAGAWSQAWFANKGTLPIDRAEIGTGQGTRGHHGALHHPQFQGPSHPPSTFDADFGAILSLAFFFSRFSYQWPVLCQDH